MSEWNKDFPRTMHLAYICKKCHTYDTVNVTYVFKNILTPEELHINEHTINYACPICKDYTRHYMVDADIAKSVSIMNKLGYKTIFSCQGHCKTEFLETPYPRYHSSLSDPYIFIKGKKKPDPKLIEALIKAGFKQWTAGQYKTFRKIDITKVDDVIDLLNSGVFSFHYGYKSIDAKVKGIYKKSNIDEHIIDSEMNEYIKSINKKLSDTLEKYYISHKEDK